MDNGNTNFEVHVVELIKIFCQIFHKSFGEVTLYPARLPPSSFKSECIL